MSNVLDKFQMQGQVAIVTGGAGLLGKQFARTLAQAGAAVVVADLNRLTAHTIAETLVKDGYPSLGVGVDVTDPASVAEMVETAVNVYGRLDVLVNSAALDPKFDPDAVARGLPAGSFEDYPLDQWRQALEVNLTGMFLCCQSAVKPMIEQGKKGSIINICSTYGLVAPDQRLYQRNGIQTAYKPVYYSVTKAGVMGMTRYLAAYYAGTDLRVNALTPGGVYNNHDEGFVTSYSARAVMGRMAHIDEMNGALLFLASEASSYMTGSNLVVDGGWTAW
ncbi:MAG TPA: SDR family oxidoreductase [Bellilinea sp.]|jgi:NAD(P)-dependent dehydrogenase (short-subunit alcohol dehydrogenase family)|nr:SDR family oxidoreductase [Bellilinea sp.]